MHTMHLTTIVITIVKVQRRPQVFLDSKRPPFPASELAANSDPSRNCDRSTRAENLPIPCHQSPWPWPGRTPLAGMRHDQRSWFWLFPFLCARPVSGSQRRRQEHPKAPRSRETPSGRKSRDAARLFACRASSGAPANQSRRFVFMPLLNSRRGVAFKPRHRDFEWQELENFYCFPSSSGLPGG